MQPGPGRHMPQGGSGVGSRHSRTWASTEKAIAISREESLHQRCNFSQSGVRDRVPWVNVTDIGFYPKRVISFPRRKMM